MSTSVPMGPSCSSGGSIVNISSIAGVKAFPGAGIYCASKAAMKLRKTQASNMVQTVVKQRNTVNDGSIRQ